jgi:hypothetical protein
MLAGLSPTRCLILCLAVASGEAAFVLPQAAGEVVHGALQQARGPVPACGRSGLEGRRRSTQRARGAGCTTCRAGGDRSHDDAASSAGEPGRSQTRRQWLLASAAAMAASVLSGQSAAAGDAERHMNIEVRPSLPSREGVHPSVPHFHPRGRAQHLSLSRAGVRLEGLRPGSHIHDTTCV